MDADHSCSGDERGGGGGDGAGEAVLDRGGDGRLWARGAGGVGGEEAEEALAAGADDDAGGVGGVGRVDEVAEVAQEREVVVDGLAEADARVDPDLLDAGFVGEADALEDEGR